MTSNTAARRQRGVTLIGLLIVMIIMGIVTTMILATWFSLGRAYSYTSKSSHAREYARDSISRMTREIRDATTGPGGVAMFRQGLCDSDTITFYSLFNKPGASVLGAAPRLVSFYLSGGKMYRKVDSNGNGSLDGGDRVDVLTTDVVNRIPPNAQDVFSYMVVLPDGSRVAVPTPSNTSAIVSIDIKLLVDLNPGKSPVFMDLTTSVQPRNLRQF